MTEQRSVSIYDEAFAFAELGRLLLDPVYYGVGLPRGDGRVVVTIPGLFGNDFYLYPVRRWLSRLGYRPLESGLAVNAGCPERLCNEIEIGIKRRPLAGRPLALVGHSRGGILARALAARLQDQVSHIVLLASPLALVAPMMSAGAPASRVARPAGAAVADASTGARRFLDPDCNVPACGCPFTTDILRPLSAATKVVSIYTRDDPIVPPAGCRLPGATNIEVAGTHTGLVYNPQALKHLAIALAA